jgi:CMP-N-acetylneuraminic acid synthetase
MKVVGIIPARGGSRGIPIKNLKDFCGKPLIAWAILSAKASNLDRVIVSTDSEEIAKVARQYGAEVPFLRPAELATETIGIEPTLRHAHEWLRDNEGYDADAVMLLHSTSPLRQTRHIDDMLELFASSGADSVVAVNETPANHTPYWTLVRSPAGEVSLWGGVPLRDIPTRRQDFLQKCYARNDLGYILKPASLFEEKPNLYGDRVELYVVPDPEIYEADINTPGEWAEAEIKARRILNH